MSKKFLLAATKRTNSSLLSSPFSGIKKQESQKLTNPKLQMLQSVAADFEPQPRTQQREENNREQLVEYIKFAKKNGTQEFNGDIEFIDSVDMADIEFDTLLPKLFSFNDKASAILNNFKSQLVDTTRNFVFAVKSYFREPDSEDIKQLKIKCVQAVYYQQTKALEEKLKIEKILYDILNGAPCRDDEEFYQFLEQTLNKEKYDMIIKAYKYDTYYRLLNYKYETILELLGNTNKSITDNFSEQLLKNLGFSKATRMEEQLQADLYLTTKLTVDDIVLSGPPQPVGSEKFLEAPTNRDIAKFLRTICINDYPTYFRGVDDDETIDTKKPYEQNENDPDRAFLFFHGNKPSANAFYNQKFGKSLDDTLSVGDQEAIEQSFEDFNARPDKGTIEWKKLGCERRFFICDAPSQLLKEKRFTLPKQDIVDQAITRRKEYDTNLTVGGKKTRKHKKPKKTRKHKKSKKSIRRK